MNDHTDAHREWLADVLVLHEMCDTTFHKVLVLYDPVSCIIVSHRLLVGSRSLTLTLLDMLREAAYSYLSADIIYADSGFSPCQLDIFSPNLPFSHSVTIENRMPIAYRSRLEHVFQRLRHSLHLFLSLDSDQAFEKALTVLIEQFNVEQLLRTTPVAQQKGAYDVYF